MIDHTNSAHTYGLGAAAVSFLDWLVGGVYTPPGAPLDSPPDQRRAALDDAAVARPYQREQLLKHIGEAAAHDLLMEVGRAGGNPEASEVVCVLLAHQLRRYARQRLRQRTTTHE